jgi:hypothetical protein
MFLSAICTVKIDAQQDIRALKNVSYFWYTREEERDKKLMIKGATSKTGMCVAV